MDSECLMLVLAAQILKSECLHYTNILVIDMLQLETKLFCITRQESSHSLFPFVYISGRNINLGNQRDEKPSEKRVGDCNDPSFTPWWQSQENVEVETTYELMG